MESNVIRHTTPEQREVVGSVDIPSFVNQTPAAYEHDEVSQVILNNVPGNTEIEEINHLNELEVVCQNWKEEEWRRILIHADSTQLCEELKRRLIIQDDYIQHQKNSINQLEQLNR